MGWAAGREAFSWGRSCSLPVCSPLSLGSLGLPGTWLPSFASSLRLADEPGAGGTWSSHGMSRASLAPATQGEGRDGLLLAPHPPLPSRGWLSETPRGSWRRLWRVRLWCRDASSLLRDEITAMSTRRMKESLTLASGGDRRLFQGWHGTVGHGAVGWCPAPLVLPVCPRQGLEPGQEPVVGWICPSRSSVVNPTLEEFTFPRRQRRSCSWAQGSHPSLPFESPRIRI